MLSGAGFLSAEYSALRALGSDVSPVLTQKTQWALLSIKIFCKSRCRLSRVRLLLLVHVDRSGRQSRFGVGLLRSLLLHWLWVRAWWWCCPLSSFNSGSELVCFPEELLAVAALCDVVVCNVSHCLQILWLVRADMVCDLRVHILIQNSIVMSSAVSMTVLQFLTQALAVSSILCTIWVIVSDGSIFGSSQFEKRVN